MALKWLEGFENATTEEIVHERIYPGFTGTFAAEDGASVPSQEAVSSGTAVYTTPVLVSPAQDSWILGFAFRPDDTASINTGNVPFVGLDNTDGEQVRFEFVEDFPASSKPGGLYFKIRAMRGATELASSNERFLLGVGSSTSALWTYFEFKATVNNATGSFEGRFQNVRKPSLNGGGATALTWDAANTNVDTQEQVSTGVDRVTISFDTGTTSDPVALDDMYICDSTGAKNNDYLGKIIIEGQRVSGDGDTTNWSLTGGATTTEDAWNEAPTLVNDDKRLTSGTIAQVHLAAVTALTAIKQGTIVGVRQDIHVKMETTGDLDIGHRWRKTTATIGEITAGTDINVASTTVEGSAIVLEDDPNTATDWDVADLDSYQHGTINNG